MYLLSPPLLLSLDKPGSMCSLPGVEQEWLWNLPSKPPSLLQLRAVGTAAAVSRGIGLDKLLSTEGKGKERGKVTKGLKTRAAAPEVQSASGSGGAVTLAVLVAASPHPQSWIHLYTGGRHVRGVWARRKGARLSL